MSSPITSWWKWGSDFFRGRLEIKRPIMGQLCQWNDGRSDQKGSDWPNSRTSEILMLEKLLKVSPTNEIWRPISHRAQNRNSDWSQCQPTGKLRYKDDNAEGVEKAYLIKRFFRYSKRHLGFDGNSWWGDRNEICKSWEKRTKTDAATIAGAEGDVGIGEKNI